MLRIKSKYKRSINYKYKAEQLRKLPYIWRHTCCWCFGEQTRAVAAHDKHSHIPIYHRSYQDIMRQKALVFTNLHHEFTRCLLVSVIDCIYSVPVVHLNLLWIKITNPHSPCNLRHGSGVNLGRSLDNKPFWRLVVADVLCHTISNRMLF